MALSKSTAVSLVCLLCDLRSCLIYSLYMIVDSRRHLEGLSRMDERDDGAGPSNRGFIGGRAGVFTGGYASNDVFNFVD